MISSLEIVVFLFLKEDIMGKFCVTTAIPYASGKSHIGNVYEDVLADVIAR